MTKNQWKTKNVALHKGIRMTAKKIPQRNNIALLIWKMQVRRQWNSIFKYWKQNTANLEFYIQ